VQNIQEHHIDGPCPNRIDGRSAVCSVSDLIFLFEDQMQGFADSRVIVDDEHERLLGDYMSTIPCQEGAARFFLRPSRLDGMHALRISLLVSLVAAALAAADHGGALRSAPMSPLTAALLFAGLALLVGAVVIVVFRVLTKGR